MRNLLAVIKSLFEIVVFLIPASVLAQGLIPGDIYREYSRTMGQTDKNWRVTDPDVKRADAHKYLPNEILEIEIGDLKGAIKAEAIIDRWGGHQGTPNKKLRFNNHEWISLPELSNTPEGQKPESYHYQDNPVIPIPLEQLREGINTFEGTCGDPSHWWPQWGWDGIIIRIFYDKSKPHSVGKITSPGAGAILGENPVITAEATGKAGIERIDFLAYYNGFDENGDGIFQDWHHHYWCLRNAEQIDISGHAGTAWQAPYEVKWDTKLVPDQEKGFIKLIARIKDNNGIWYVTETVDSLSIRRNGYSIKMYNASDIPASFNVRNYQSKSCKIYIPPKTELQNSTEAWFCIRTWNGYAPSHEPFTINSWLNVLQGNNHNFDMDIIPVPGMAIRPGDNLISFYSKTVHHGVEVLWPGPALIVRIQTQQEH